MKHKEIPILYAKRPLALSPVSEIKVKVKENLLDEDIALKLGFPIHQIQYKHFSLLVDECI